MNGALDVLVVDDRPETVRFLTEFLLQRCRRVDVATNVKEAMTFITRRHAANEVYHLILSDFVMPGADGLSFLRELRLRNESTPFAFITGYRSLNPTLDAEAKRLGVLAILDKPIELREVESLLNQVTSSFRRANDNSAEAPFFGTSRTMRRPTEPSSLQPTQPSQALEPRVPSEPLAMPSAAGWQAPSLALEPRQPQAPPASSALESRPPPALIFTPPPVAPMPVAPPQAYHARPTAIISYGSTTSRIRRGVDPVARAPQDSAHAPNPTSSPQSTSFTARSRRGIEGTGSFRDPAGGTESGRMVTCANCGKDFLTLAKAETYTTLCVHCGQLQRIEPL
jgi:CheY-like chemotaxis protein